MEQTKFLEQHIFTDLKNLNNGSNKGTIKYFSESDFEIVLTRVEHFGVSIYRIESLTNNETYGVSVHEEHKKKATDPKWYKKAFLTFKTRQPGLTYSATYKVSNKLLKRESTAPN